jgi:hypothetical protein
MDLNQVVRDYQGKALKDEGGELTVGAALAFALAVHKIEGEGYLEQAKRSMLARQIEGMDGIVEFNAKQRAMLLDAVGGWQWPRGGEVDILLAIDPKLSEKMEVA